MLQVGTRIQQTTHLLLRSVVILVGPGGPSVSCAAWLQSFRRMRSMQAHRTGSAAASEQSRLSSAPYASGYHEPYQSSIHGAKIAATCYRRDSYWRCLPLLEHTLRWLLLCFDAWGDGAAAGKAIAIPDLRSKAAPLHGLRMLSRSEGGTAGGRSGSGGQRTLQQAVHRAACHKVWLLS